MSRDRNDDEASLQLDRSVALDLPLDPASATRDVGAMEDALAAEALVQSFVIGNVVAVGEEVPARPAHRLDPIEERVRRPRRIDDEVSTVSHDEIAGRAVGGFGPQPEIVDRAVDVERERRECLANFPSLRAPDRRRRASDEGDERILPLGGNRLPLHVRETAAIRSGKRRRSDLPAGVAVDAGRIDEKRPRGILRETQVSRATRDGVTSGPPWLNPTLASRSGYSTTWAAPSAISTSCRRAIGSSSPFPAARTRSRSSISCSSCSGAHPSISTSSPATSIRATPV